jgi:ribonuclease D
MASSVDIADEYPRQGLASVILNKLKVRLKKDLQKSDWQRRPLLSEQKEYAALDAYILVLLHTHMSDET